MAGSWPSRVGVVASLAALGPLVFASALPAKSTGGPAPGYPNSRLSISVPAKARAGSIVTVTFSGTNAAFTEGAPITYALEAFVQQRSVLPRCPRAFSDEFNNYIDLGGTTIGRI